MTDVSAADALRTSCVLSQDDIARAEAVAVERGLPLERAVVEMGLLAEDQVLWFVARRADIDLVFPTVEAVDAELLARFPADALRRLDALPMLQDEDGTIVVAFPSPPDAATIGDLERACGMSVRAALAAAPRIRHVLARLLGAPSVDVPAAAPASAPRDGDGGAAAAFLRHLTAALRDGADELRFEPAASGVRVRSRVGGVLRIAEREPAEFGPAVAARARTLAGLTAPARPIVERATLRVPIGGRTCRLALTIVPTSHGPCVLLRMLPPADVPQDLDGWTLPEDADAWIRARFLGPAAGREVLHVRADDDDLRGGLLRSVAAAADQAGLAVAWVGPRGACGVGPWLEIEDGPDAGELVAAARPDVVVADATDAAFAGVRRVVRGIASARESTPIDRAAAVLDVSADWAVCSACDGLRSDECGQCRGAARTGGGIVVETRNLPGTAAGGSV